MTVLLSLMTENDYEKFYSMDKELFISSYTSRGMTPEDALFIFERIWKSLAPNSFTDKMNYFLNILTEKENQIVGYVWLTEKAAEPYNYAFLSSIVIFPEFRRQGYGTMAMLQLESFIKKLGINELRFQVDGENEIAYRMYKNLDYKVTAHLMRKKF